MASTGLHWARTGLLVACVLAAGCAGTRYAIRADQARYPISFSPVLPDEQGRPLYLGSDLEACGTLQLDQTQLGFLYSATGTDVDISAEVNKQVAAAGGVGIASLAVSARNCSSNWLFPLTILPFWPGCQQLKIEGVVVRPVAKANAESQEAQR